MDSLDNTSCTMSSQVMSCHVSPIDSSLPSLSVVAGAQPGYPARVLEARSTP